MKILLIFLILFIGFYECYWPIPDLDKKHFEYYKLKTAVVLGVAKIHHVPVELLIFHKITDKKKFFQYLDARDYIKYNTGEKKIISKFKTWLNDNGKTKKKSCGSI